jgi:hypothetical protein
MKLHSTVLKQLDKYRKHCLWRGAEMNDKENPRAASTNINDKRNIQRLPGQWFAILRKEALEC